MPAVKISASLLRRQIEREAASYGMPQVLAAMISAYVVRLLREAATEQPNLAY